MSVFLYTISLRCYFFAIQIAALFSSKAKLWMAGRKQLSTLLKQNKLAQLHGCVWVHASSLGEFEQARPLIERIKKQDANQKILLSFYSPSGYEHRKNYELADQVIYLPMDTSKDVELLITQAAPSCVIWVRYEFWHHVLTQLKARQIPTYLISASFRSDQIFFRFYGQLFRNILNNFNSIFVINEQSQILLQQTGINNSILAPDTRMDRVYAIASNSAPIAAIEKFLNNRACKLVAGSTWQADINILFQSINSDNQNTYIIAPHHVDEANLSYIESKLTIPNIRFSQLKNKESIFEQVLIIDNMGMLASLYKYGKYAYVGGGFGVSVHNVLEAIVYDKPVMFGPHHRKQFECGELIKKEVATVVYTSKEIADYMADLDQNEDTYKQKCQAANHYVSTHIGGTEMIYNQIQKHLS